MTRCPAGSVVAGVVTDPTDERSPDDNALAQLVDDPGSALAGVVANPTDERCPDDNALAEVVDDPGSAVAGVVADPTDERCPDDNALAEVVDDPGSALAGVVANPTDERCPDDNALAQLADGAIDPVGRAGLERHLDGCERCAAVVAELAWVIAPPRPAPPAYRLLGPRGDDCWDAEDVRTGRAVELCFQRGDPWPALRHPNLVEVVEAGELGAERFTATERIAAPTARAWLRAAPRTSDEIASVWSQAIAGVAALHRAGAVHGGLSPDRVFVLGDGRVVVGAAGRRLAPGSGRAALELLRGAEPSPASDQFALCAAAWEALAGRRPFRGATIGALALTMSLPPATPPSLPRRLRAVLARGLTPTPAARWPSLDALSRGLARPRRWGWLAAALMLLAVAAVAAMAT